MADPDPQVARMNELIAKWNSFRVDIPAPERFDQIRRDLYQVRNAGWDGNPPIGTWPPELVDPDDAMMAAVEHYYLCRAWVGSGKFPAWEMSVLNFIYDAGKVVGASPRHNPNKPTTKLSSLQLTAQKNGVRDGKVDLATSGQSAPWAASPPKYW
ncbi:hypothetical protein BTHE68_56550 [Burkholderia sp. THE68]|uniref:hypothetical protein n=1 Tax=Burkholderia sp. THE68 TaxID=758782 RepID=UPI00131822E4|nr:hypothetical protein [Burkholderia sp. THE68]BBU31921.1 hypothetical protein BTHE68_56550 [Burkholderia sp. THE68]